MNRIDLYIEKWQLTRQGEAFATNTSIIQACTYAGQDAILKIALVEEEKRGAKLMQWWNGIGSANVLAMDANAVLLERIENKAGINLISLVNQGKDTEATQIICRTANILHAHKPNNLPPLIPLKEWFNSLLNTSHFTHEALIRSAEIASSILNQQKEECVLHGDLHHENILYSELTGWRAIDPKGLYGDRAFDFANILCNPNRQVALEAGRFEEQLNVICSEANIAFPRMLDWTIAWTGLSAVWMEEDNLDASLPLEVGKLALELKIKLYKSNSLS